MGYIYTIRITSVLTYDAHCIHVVLNGKAGLLRPMFISMTSHEGKYNQNCIPIV